MLIRTYADIERLQGEDALSEAEQLLIENCRIGEPTVLGDSSLPEGPRSERTIRAGLLRYLILGGCEQCRAHEKGVQVKGAWIDGQLDLSFASAKGAVRLLRCSFTERLEADQANFDLLALSGRSLAGLNAQGANIKGDVLLRKLESTGEVSFAGAQIDGQFEAVAAELNSGEGTALNGQSATIRGNVFIDNLKSTGEVSFSGAEIGGQFSGAEAELDGGKGHALNVQRCTIRGGVFLAKLKSAGCVSFSGAEIVGQFLCDGANMRGLLADALNVQNAKIQGPVFLRDFSAVGHVSFSGAKISGQLACDRAKFEHVGGRALNLQRVSIGDGFYWRGVESVAGAVDLSSAYVGDLADDEDSWDRVIQLSLVGLTYENIGGPFNLPFRKRWLKKGASPVDQFHPQPYQQLAKFYRETGHRYEAREILVAKEVEQRKATRKAIREGKARTESWLIPDVLAFLNLLWDWTTRLIAGYGYKPWLSLWWLGCLVGLMMLAAQATWNAGDFAPNSAVVLTSQDWKAIADGPSENPAADWTDALAPGKDYETFYSFAYALDVVVPVLDLGQTDAWAPSPARGDWGYWMFYLQKIFIVLGWVVTAIAAAAISGMIRRDD